MQELEVIEIIEFCKDIPNTIKLNERIIKNLEDQYYYPSFNGDMDGLPKSKNNISKTTENLALNIPDGVSETLRSLEEKNKRLNRLYQEIINEIQSLEYREHKVIYDFYIMGYRWAKIARGFYSERQCKNIRVEAIKKLEKKFQENEIIYNYFTKG